MWRFQRAKHKLVGLLAFRGRQLFFGELLLASLLFHLVVLLFLLVIYSSYRYSTKLVVRRSGVQLLPAYFVRPATSTTVQSNLGAAAVQPPAQKVTSAKMPSTTIKKEEPKKPATTKQTSTKANAKKPSQPQKTKPKEEPKKMQTQKNQQKQQPAKKQTPSKKEQPKPQAKKQDDFDTPRIQQYIQSEVSKRWTPPIGLPDDLVCEVTIQVGGDGVVTDAIIEESSGVLVYDLSARSAAALLSLPRWAWGKEFMISFNQE